MTTGSHRTTRPGPGPVLHPTIAPFWEAIAGNTFVLPRCAACGYRRFPVLPVCPCCLGFDTTWEAVSGSGTVAAAVMVEQTGRRSSWSEATPFLAGLVDLDAGVRVPGRLICDCGDATRPGTRVEMTTLPTDDGSTTFGFLHACGGSRNR